MLEELPDNSNIYEQIEPLIEVETDNKIIVREEKCPLHFKHHNKPFNLTPDLLSKAILTLYISNFSLRESAQILGVSFSWVRKVLRRELIKYPNLKRL